MNWLLSSALEGEALVLAEVDLVDASKGGAQCTIMTAIQIESGVPPSPNHSCHRGIGPPRARMYCPWVADNYDMGG
jgi:hypothetical protein